MFENYSWKTVNAASYPDLNTASLLKAGIVPAVRIAPLLFFEDVFLLEKKYIPEKDDAVFFLVRQDLCFHLEGTSSRIFDMSDISPIRIDDETVLDYIEFFCSFVHGEEGPFFIVKDISHPAFDRCGFDEEMTSALPTILLPPKITGVLESGTYEAFATVLYGTALFSATFRVYPDGRIEMMDANPLCKKIPVKKISLGCGGY